MLVPPYHPGTTVVGKLRTRGPEPDTVSPGADFDGCDGVSFPGSEVVGARGRSLLRVPGSTYGTRDTSTPSTRVEDFYSYLSRVPGRVSPRVAGVDEGKKPLHPPSDEKKTSRL